MRPLYDGASPGHGCDLWGKRMLKLARSKGEKIEIEGCALIRVAKIEDKRVRIDITAPFAPALRAEDENCELCPAECVVIKLVDIYERAKSGCFRATIGVRVPGGGKAHRAEVRQQRVPEHLRFPWRRFKPTARYWRSIDEEILIVVPQ